MTEQKPDAGVDGMASPSEPGYCEHCGVHFSDPHSPQCPADQGGIDSEACLWMSRAAIQALIGDAAQEHGAEVYTAGQWGDPDAEVDVVTTPAACGIVAVHYDDVAEATAHAAHQVLVYVYRASRTRGAGEGIAGYVAAAMLAPDGSNREPVEVTRPDVAEAIAAGLDALTA
jgi:hypothetical protein